MVKVKVVSYQEYQGMVGGDDIRPLIGNETLYPEEFLGPLINTFTTVDPHNDENINMKTYYFNITNGIRDTIRNTLRNEKKNNDIKMIDLTDDDIDIKQEDYNKSINIFLKPKYTFDNYFNEIMGNKCIIVSDEIFRQYFQDSYEIFEFHLVYNIPDIDMLSLKRIRGDFPKDNTIDILLTDFLESCTIINYLQEFTLFFQGNEYPLQNEITFQVFEITYKKNSVKDIEDRLEEIDLTMKLNKNLENIHEDRGLNDCENKVMNFHWYDAVNSADKKRIGLVANNEVKIDFIVTELPRPEVRKIQPMELQKSELSELHKAELQKAELQKEKHVFNTKGLVLDQEEDSKPLTKEEMRMKRLQSLESKKIEIQKNRNPKK